MLSSKKVFPLFFRPICKDQDDPVKAELRSQKASNCLCTAIYMIYSTSFGYYVLKDQYFMPKALGGDGDFALVFNEHPYPKHVPYMKEYYISVTAYHLGQLAKHALGNHENDFIEMGFHHLVTIYLMVGSYLFNVWECGAVISFLHDAADISVMLSKCFSQTVYDKATITCFASMLLSWGWCRNV